MTWTLNVYIVHYLCILKEKIFSKGVCSQMAYYEDYFSLGFVIVISMNDWLALDFFLPLYIH